RVQTIERLIENQHARIMGHGGGQLDSLAHAFAVTGDILARGIGDSASLERPPRCLPGIFGAVAMQRQLGNQEGISGETFWKRVELRAISHKTKQPLAVGWVDTEDANRSAGR